MSAQSNKKAARRHQTLVAHPGVALEINPCLGKVRYASEEDAAAQASFRCYPCGWCGGFHTSAHGFKGSRKGR